MKYQLTSSSGGITKIYIGGLLHLAFDRTKLACMQSWIGEWDFKIELTFHSGKMVIEYDRRDKWETVLKLLDKALQNATTA